MFSRPRPSALSLLLAATLVAATGTAQAAITVFTSQASFLAAVASPGLDTFTGFSTIGSTPSPITRTSGTFSYSAAAPGDFFGAGSIANPYLSTNQATDTITFSSFSGGASAVGGNFFGSDISGAFAAGSVTLVATDSLGATSTQTISGATSSSFLGFASNSTLVSLSLSSVQPANGSLWPTADNLRIALAIPVPEPGTGMFMLTGLGLGLLLARRRRA